MEKPKVIFLCAGKGTRLLELTHEIPKPLIEVGEKPLLIHLMNMYSHYGFNEFIVHVGHMKEQIIDWFKFNDYPKDWQIQFSEESYSTNTSGGILKASKLAGNFNNIMVSYGDDLANVNVKELYNFHLNHNKKATLTSVQPYSAFGVLKFNINNPNLIQEFKEKPKLDDWINAGFLVLKKEVIDYLKEGEDLSKTTLPLLAKENELMAYKHPGFWMDIGTYKDVLTARELWNSGKKPWVLQ
ncbi:MAG: sugar phosphate nucleotidyltransferase [Candidatus Micrarchaeia archaeon]|jgi:glucose-1-phosphate cytidylyltransferase